MNSDTPPVRQFRSLNWPVGVGLVLAALGLYISTLAPTVLEADAGEFQFVPWLPGIAHPGTGYPMYTLLGWLWTHLLPIGEVAWRMNLLSAMFAALAVGLTYAVTRRLLDITLPDTPVPARVIAAALAAVTLAVTPTFWSQAIIAEVYALHTLLIAGILWLALKYKSREHTLNSWSGTLLAFTFGLGLTHHSTTILLSPALLIFLWTTRLPSEQKVLGFGKVKSMIIPGLVLLAPLLLYLYLPLVAPSTPYTTLALSDSQTLILYDNSVQGFLRHVTGTVFVGELRPAAVGIERFLLTWQLLRQQVGWVGVILALSGLVTLWQQQQLNLLLLTGVAFLTFVAFNLIYFIGDVFVLFIPAWFFVCLWLGIGSLGLAHWIATSFVRHKMGANEYVSFKRMRERLSRNMYWLAVTFLLLFLFVLPVVLLTTRMSEISQKNNIAAGQRWQEILTEPIPKAAILLSNDRNELMPMWYYQYVEGLRPDLLGLFPLIVPDPAFTNVGRVLDQALASERPIYLIKPMDGLELKAYIQPEGTLFRVRPYNTPPFHSNSVTLPQIIIPSPSGEELSETITLLGYDLSPNEISPGDEISLTLHWQVVQELSIDYTSYVHLITSDEQGITQSDHKPGGDFYPSSYWQSGEILRDRHTLSIPSDAPAGVYRLRVGMYYQPEPGVIKGMGDGTEIGQLKLRVVGA